MQTTMRRIVVTVLGGVVAVGLAACGDSQPGRLQGGAAGGAATGAVVGILGGPIGVVLGAGIGAGVGALTSTNTTPRQVDLGRPVWQRVTIN